MKISPAFTDESAFSPASILTRNNVRVFGSGSRTMIFAHGLGCDQHMWRHITPAFEADYRIVLFDHVGSGHSDLTAYDPAKHASLEGYATDLLEICAALEISDAIFVGHSVSAMIGVLAELREPWRFHRMIHIGPSPRYIDDEGYRGGFSRGEIQEMLEFLDSNYFGWVAAMTPAIRANGERPELAEELGNSFCRTDPEIARRFARVTFLSDNRRDLARVSTPPSSSSAARTSWPRSRSANICARICPSAASSSWRRPATARISARRMRRSAPCRRNSRRRPRRMRHERRGPSGVGRGFL